MTTQAPTIYVGVDAKGKVTSKRVHLYDDCSALEEVSRRSLTEREQQLLGLSQCTRCEKRRAGGPAIEVLEGFFGEDWPYTDEQIDDGPSGAAWKLHSYLREHNFYLAQRKPKDAK